MFSKFSVKKPLTVFVGVILVILLGILSFTGMTTDLLPKIDLPYVVVVTTYPGASPEKVELSVTKPLEKVLATSSGIKNINSISRENSSMIILEFDQKTNMDSVMIDLSGKLDLVKPQLEDEVSSPMLMKMNPDMMPIMIASVDINDSELKETSKAVEEKIIPSFERIEGVASVEATGLIKESIKITLDDKKIQNLNDKVLKSVDSKLAESKKKLDSGKAKVAEGKAVLARESAGKTEELVEGSIALGEGKNQIESALNNLPKLQKDLEKQKKDLTWQRDALAWIIKNKEENGLPVSEEEKRTLEQLEKGIKAVEDGLLNIKAQEPVLSEKLNSIRESQKKLEMGKITLTQELTKASMNLANSEAELEKASKEFEKARDEAYKKADLDGVITKDTISKILMAENFSMPAGYIKEGEEQYIVKVGDKFSSLEELKNLVLFNIEAGGVGEVHLEDIGSIEFTDNSKNMYAKINGNDGIILSFQKQSTASTSEVSKKLNKNIEKLVEENPEMHITPLQDQGVYIHIVIDSVMNNLILGGILAVVILFIFLRNIRPTIIIAFSIPISLMFALVMMYFSGVTMNIISLAGLALGVGMLVDNSIVVIENIYRLRSDGMNVVQAAVKGANQVAGAIFASTLTTICVFLPIVFTQGISRQLFTDMGLTIAYSLLASLIIALTLVPTMASTMLKNNKDKEHKAFDRFLNKYESWLNFSLKHKWVVLISALVLFVGSFLLSVSKGTSLMPSMDSNQISVSLEMPKGTSIKETREMSDVIIDRISSISDVKTVGALQGSGEGAVFGGGNKNVSFYVLLKEDKQLSSQDIGSLISKETSDLNCKLTVRSENMDMSALGGSGVEVIVKGRDLDELKRISKDIAKILEDTEGIKDISKGVDEASLETRITVDKNKAMKHGLTVAQVYQEIASAIKSEVSAAAVTFQNSDYPVIIVNDAKSSLTKDTLKDYGIKVSKEGKEEKVSLKDIASIEEVESLEGIMHDNQSRFISVKGAVDKNHNVGLVSNEVEKKLKDYELPQGYSIKMGGEKEAMESAFKDLIKMIVLAIAFIYLIMVAQFQSLLSPFIVMFTIPLAFTGGFLALVITGFELSMISMLGFLMLSGIVVNNGIVFVDYVNQLRLEGVDKREALVLTGRTRMRPILMTALTTVLGLFTLALGMGMGSDMIQPMAIVTIGGLTYATILTLFIVPIIYDMLHKKDIKAVVIEEDV